MYPKNPITGINNFLNKQFGVPLPKSSSSTSLGTGPNMSYAPVNTPNMSMVPSNTGATTTKPVVITPPKTQTNPAPKLPPAGQTFIQNQVQPFYDSKTGLLTDYGRSQGMKEINAPNTGGTTAPGGPNLTPEGQNNAPVAPKPESPYLAYLRSMFDPEALKKASGDLTDATTRLADIQNQKEAKELYARRRYEEILDTPGGTVSGARQAASVEDRRNNAELADLALRESAAARSAGVYKDTYDMMIGAGKSVFEAETAASKAEQDQKNKEREFGQTDTQIAETAKKNAADQLLKEKMFEEDKRQFGLEYALKKQELAQKTSEAAATATGKDAEALSSMNLINTLLENPNIGAITGAVDQYRPGLLMGGNARIAKNQYEQVKGILALENRQKLKGQGAVSDFEGKTLERAASSLSRNLDNADFVKQLKQVRGAIATSHGLSADILIIDPKTKQSQIVLSNSLGIAEAIKDGFIVEYQ